ncbi:hypothetical protein OG897_21595 [Streptomyces sp. NBC_00237]|uniref:hypothetical protein n=1 Tax=Streptomyces sp. NBC_00237 TaxID=2975687 RepID=UPI0022553A4D|nr:hypothetical protein [Streptomyces sp. NBC_00237]MCX5204033.1 hypothetical protein [Streptomyces sp. NBC_00237]
MHEYEIQTRHADLVEAAAHARLVREARQAREARRQAARRVREAGTRTPARSGLSALRSHFTRAA